MSHVRGELPHEVRNGSPLGCRWWRCPVVPFFDRNRLVAWLSAGVLFEEPTLRAVAYLDDQWRIFRLADGALLGALRDCAIRDRDGGVVAFFTPGASLGRRAAPIGGTPHPTPRPPPIHNPGRPRRPPRPVPGGVAWGSSWKGFLAAGTGRGGVATALTHEEVRGLFQDAWMRSRAAAAPSATLSYDGGGRHHARRRASSASSPASS